MVSENKINICEDTAHIKKIEIEKEITIEKLKNEIKNLCSHNECVKIKYCVYPFPIYECRKCYCNFSIHQKKKI